MTAMITPLRVLVVKDSASEAHLILNTLRQGGFDPSHAQVDTAKAMAAALEARTWDIVVSDCRMRWFNGIEALRLLRQSGSDLPFILISATVGEEAAVEAMRAGANDFLVKDHLARLVPAVRREIAEAGIRRGKREVEGRLRENERRLLTLMSNLPGMAYRCRNERDWRMEFVSEGCVELTGYAPEDIILNRTISYAELIHPDDAERIWEEVQSATQQRRPYRFEYRIRSATGGEKWVWEQGRAVFDPTGAVLALEGFITDITERKRVQDALRFSEERFRRYFEVGLIGTAITDPGKGILEVNDRICEILGYERSELVRMTWAEMTHPDDLAADVAKFNRVLAGEIDGYSIDKRWIRKDGRIIDSTIAVKCMRRADGSVDYFVALVEDITERKRAENQIRESENQFDTLARVCPVGIFRTDADGRAMYWNEKLCEMTGLSVEESLGAGWMSGIHPEDRARAVEEWNRSVAEGRPLKLQHRLVHREGTVRWIIAEVEAIRDAKERVTGYVGTITDISELKRAEEAHRSLSQELEAKIRERTGELKVANELLNRALVQVRESRERAEAADRIKSDFLATMSHELRTPLNSIIGFTGILLQGLGGPLNEEQTKQLGFVRDSANHLLALINDVLDLSKIEAGQLKVAMTEFDLPGLLEKVVRSVRPLAEKKGLEFKLAVSPGIGRIRTDSRRLEQILLNLISNAIKFTEAGSVRVECESADGSVCTRVSDTGIGIRAEDMAGLFQPFHQVDSGSSRRFEGTGLGLSICRHLTTLLGGEIFARSEWGRGSTFGFTLPLAGDGS
jgi:two-component system, sensor histidine kinase and response regulator